jgi:hypothetical protein
MRYLICLAVLAPLSAQAQSSETIATYEGTVSLTTTRPVSISSPVDLQLFVGDSLIDNRQAQYRRTDGITMARLAWPELMDGIDGSIAFRVAIEGGEGIMQFNESQIDYRFAHAGADFFNNALVREVDWVLFGIPQWPLESGSQIDGRVQFKFVGIPIEAVPEPAAWVLCLAGVACLYSIRRKYRHIR